MANSHQPPFLNSHISQPTPHTSPFSRSSGPHQYALVLVVRVQPIVFRFGLRHHRDFHTCRFDSECSLCRLFRLGHTCIPYSAHYRYTGSTVGASQTAKSLTLHAHQKKNICPNTYYYVAARTSCCNYVRNVIFYVRHAISLFLLQTYGTIRWPKRTFFAVPKVKSKYCKRHQSYIYRGHRSFTAAALSVNDGNDHSPPRRYRSPTGMIIHRRGVIGPRR